MKENLVSIIIVNYKTKELIINCLSSIYNNIHNISFEIIVVDNNSNDGSVEYIKSNFSSIKIICCKKNYGFGIANNIGVANSNGKYIFLLNSDTLLNYNILIKLINFYETNPSLKIGVLGTLLINEKKEIIHSFGNFAHRLSHFLLNKTLEDENITLKKILKNYYSKVDVVIGANMFMERKIYQKFNGFDPKIFLYEEEMEFQYRLTKNNLFSYILNEQGIIHLEGKSSESFFKREHSFKSMCYIIKKHLPLSEYYFFRIKWIFYAICFFKNPQIKISEKIKYLYLVALYNQ